MRFNILGSLEVREGERLHTPRASKTRKLLALLVGHVNRPVTTSSLMEELWGEHLPASAPSTLQTYICQIRRMLAGTAMCQSGTVTSHDVLISAPDAYRLVISFDCVDAWKFVELADEGTRAHRAGQPEHASRLLSESLDLWRGPALADVRTGPLLEAQVRRLEEKRLCALETRIEADMVLGKHRLVVDELKALTTEYPLHEGLHSQLMQSLCQLGRRADALHTYRRFRSVLVDELGIEPSAQLQEAQHAVLRGA